MAQNGFALMHSLCSSASLLLCVKKWYNARCPMIGDATLKNHRVRYSAAYPMGRERIGIV